VAVAVASLYVEFGLPGVALIPAIYLWSSERRREAAVLAATTFLLTAWLNQVHGGLPALLGTLACVPIAWVARELPVSAPRLQLAFYLVYPLHLALIGALNALA
jgi:TraX protein